MQVAPPVVMQITIASNTIASTVMLVNQSIFYSLTSITSTKLLSNRPPGDVVSISGEDAVHLCVVTEAKPGVTLPCIHLGKVKSGLDTVIKAAGNLTNGNICIRDGGFVLQI